MTKRDYVAVAEAIAPELAGGLGTTTMAPRAAACRIALALADRFEAENPRFDRAVFLRACGVYA